MLFILLHYIYLTALVTFQIKIPLIKHYNPLTKYDTLLLIKVLNIKIKQLKLAPA